MRRSVLACAVLLALASPAFADEVSDAKSAIADAGLSDQADLLLWCGAAFTIASSAATDDATKKSTDELATKLFNKAAPIMAADGVAEADFGQFGTNYALVAKSQIVDNLEEPEHTQEECTDAANAE